MVTTHATGLQPQQVIWHIRRYDKDAAEWGAAFGHHERSSMKNFKLALFSCVALSSFFTFAVGSFAQTGGESPRDCDKLGPRTWKAGSIEEMRTQEASYWACRMGVPTETVRQWQQASNAPDRIDRIKIGIVDKQELVFIQRMGGTMRCFSFSALKKTSKGWEEVWEDNGEGYCMMKCPGIEMKIFNSRLALEVPKSSDPDCKQIFQRKVFIWDDKTFRPAADHGVGKP